MHNSLAKYRLSNYNFCHLLPSTNGVMLKPYVNIRQSVDNLREPPVRYANSTHTDGHRLLPPRLAEAKTVNRFAIIITLMPERHLKLLPGQVVQAKNLYCLRVSVADIFFIPMKFVFNVADAGSI